MSGETFGCHSLGGGVTGMEEVEAREATMASTIQRVTSTRKNYLAQDISRAEVDKPATTSCFCTISGNSVHWGHYSASFKCLPLLSNA